METTIDDLAPPAVTIAPGAPLRTHDRSPTATPASDDPSPLLSAAGLRRRWGSGEGATVALDGVDLSVRRGELLAVVGPSGSGKSTLGAIVAGIDRPDAGAVVVDGVRVDRLRREALARWRATTVGIVFQEPHLMPVLTAQENVQLSLRLAGVRRGRRARAGDALDAVGLAGRHDRYPSQLSGGERQRVGVARALAARPALVVADEPTGALDRANGLAVFALLAGLCTEGTAVVLITHDLDLAARADRVVGLLDGRIVSAHVPSGVAGVR